MPEIKDEETLGKLRDMLRRLVKVSDDKLSDRVAGWKLAEDMNQSYMPAKDAERMAKQQNGKWTESFTSLTVPYGYAVQMAIHTYLCSVMLSRDPVYQALGRTGQGQDAQLMVESLIDYQYQSGGFLPRMYLFLNDTLQYGVGIHGYYWDEEETNITAYATKPKMAGGLPVLDLEGNPEFEEIEEVQTTKGYVGNKMFNVRPSEFLFDTRVSFIDFQRGEFCGRRLRWTKSELAEKKYDSGYFGVEGALDSSRSGKDNDLSGDNPSLVETSDSPDTLAFGSKRSSGMFNVKEMYVRLIPSEYKLGKNTRHEIWKFTLVEDRHIIEARPSGWLHGMFPFVVQPYEFDGYGLSSRGIPQIGQPLNQTLDWLLNSHMYNVKKAVNNEFIFDPSKISTKDFLDPNPGKRIRLLPAGYGKDIRSMVYQLPQVDYTRQNITDIGFIEGIFQRVFGATPQMMGAMQAGGRRSATEVRSQNAGGVNRLKILTEWISATSFSPAFNMLLSSSRQMYDEGMQLRISGSANAQQGGALRYDPEAIAGGFDFIPVDGTLPIDRFATAAMFKEMLMAVQQMPQIAGRYDLAAIFAWTAKLSGIRNLESFELKAQDPNKIANEVQLGNMVSGKDAINGSKPNAGAGSGEFRKPQTGVQGAPTVSGMGPTG